MQRIQLRYYSKEQVNGIQWACKKFVTEATIIAHVVYFRLVTLRIDSERHKLNRPDVI